MLAILSMTNQAQVKTASSTSVVLGRTNKILEIRRNQIMLNWLCYKGGKPYIQRRLHRGVHEDEVSWAGSIDEKENAIILPRIERTHCVPYASRIVDKIEEYIFGRPIKRDGADVLFLKNADKRKTSVNDLYKLLSEYWTVCGWGWVGVDRTSITGEPSRTKGEKERNKDSVYWTVYAPWEVPDWCYDSDGLKWIITEKPYYDNSDPNISAQEYIIRTFWERGGKCTINKLKAVGGGLVTTKTVQTSCAEVPFVLLGEISPEPHWFDSVELIAASLLNMESEAHINLSKDTYAIPVVPAEVMGDANSALGRSQDETITATKEGVVAQKIFGRKNPIYEGEESKGITRFVSPPVSDLSAYPSEIERVKKSLYEIAGLGLSKQKDTADAESADAKQFDHLDINAVLRDQAQSIQFAEERAIELSKCFDTDFKGYKPVYPTEFNVMDVTGIVNAIDRLTDLGVEIPDTLKVAAVRACSEFIPNLSEDERQAIAKEVEKSLKDERSAIERIARAAVLGRKIDASEDEDADGISTAST